ncbi:MAG: tetratricopeptide repeat protein, partial [Planctomycetes bacterium]|nr:tetratricopeptide repeat protein [Planctomycetota bacterium]
MPSPAADRDPIRENPADDSFDVLLEEAYGPRLEQASPDGGEAASFLEVIRERTRSTSHRARRTAERETVPLTDQGVLALEWQADSAQRYRMLEEISRGGIGVVFRVRDTNLDRDVAIKVLRGGYRASETMVQRFEEEAQIEGRLQHPGIVPVHDAGHLADRRPFFTMKLVEGDTLASLLRQRRTPQEDRRRFLSIFEKLLETVAYAHSRDVIHRDLKPSNVMVGAFGEVQVMDWGLSKVLGAETAEAGPGGTEPAAELAAPATTAEPRSETGSVMGTPAYMPPEQARGEVAKLDAHSDVFSLGAILCEILTGEPPFTGSSPREIRARAAEADLRPALERLAASHADRELVELATRCLAADPLARPRDAREVAGAFAGYLASLEERARAAEIAAARAEVKAAEERRARRLTLALAATILLALLAAGAAYLWLDAARRARVAENTRAVNGALAEAASLRGQARGAGVGDLSPWVRAVEAARRAVLTARPGEVDADVEIRAAALLAEVEDEQQAARAAAAQAAADRATVEQLEDIRLRAADLWDTASDYEAQTDAAYAAAFRDHGIDVDALSPDEAARRIAASTVSMPLVAALDDWVGVRRRQAERGKGKPDWARLHAIAQAADPDPVRRRARDAWRADDLTTLRALAGEADVASWPVATLVVLGGALGGAGDLEQAVSLLAEARRHHPRDFWIHHNLGVLLDRLKPPRLQEAARCLEVAVAIRPTSVSTRTSLAVVLLRMGELEAAERACRDALRIAPGYAGALHTLGLVQQRTGRLAEARASLEEAIRRRPDSLASHAALADILRAAGAPADGLTRINAAIEGAPGQAGFHYMRGRILQDLGKHDEAAAAFHRAIELDPRHADAHVQLGLSLKRLGKAGEAIAEYEAALRIDPGHAIAHLNLGVALVERGDRAGAAAAFRRAVESDPRLVAAHNSLGELLARQGDLDGAAASYRRALAVEPEDVTALVGLGRAVSRQGHPRESLRWFDEALRVQPGCYAALDALAVVWLEQLG